VTAPITWNPTAKEALRRLDGRLFATVTETAAILRYDARTVRKAIEAGEIPAVRAGSTYLPAGLGGIRASPVLCGQVGTVDKPQPAALVAARQRLLGVLKAGKQLLAGEVVGVAHSGSPVAASTSGSVDSG
jgi:excisionase family DNA binding protein